MLHETFSKTEILLFLSSHRNIYQDRNQKFFWSDDSEDKKVNRNLIITKPTWTLDRHYRKYGCVKVMRHISRFFFYVPLH